MSRYDFDSCDPAMVRARQKAEEAERARKASEQAKAQRVITAREVAVRAQLLPAITRGDAGAQQRFIDSVAREFSIAVEYCARVDAEALGYAIGRRIVVPFPNTRQNFAICLHEAGHVLSEDCNARRGQHQPQQDGRWHRCVQCETLAWAAALRLVAFDRAMFRELQRALGWYRSTTPAPVDVARAADTLMLNRTWCEARQRALEAQLRQDQQASVLADIAASDRRQRRRDAERTSYIRW